MSKLQIQTHHAWAHVSLLVKLMLKWDLLQVNTDLEKRHRSATRTSRLKRQGGIEPGIFLQFIFASNGRVCRCTWKVGLVLPFRSLNHSISYYFKWVSDNLPLWIQEFRLGARVVCTWSKCFRHLRLWLESQLLAQLAWPGSLQLEHIDQRRTVPYLIEALPHILIGQTATWNWQQHIP